MSDELSDYICAHRRPQARAQGRIVVHSPADCQASDLHEILDTETAVPDPCQLHARHECKLGLAGDELLALVIKEGLC